MLEVPQSPSGPDSAKDMGTVHNDDLLDQSKNVDRTLEIRPHRRQRRRVVKAPDLKSVGRGFKSRSDR